MKVLKLIIPIYYLWGLICKHVEGSEIDCLVCCACCKDRVCGPGKYFSNECTNGCIDGYAGARCYGKCTHNCRKCDLFRDLDTCTECYDGYFPGPANDCTSKCLPNCKNCTSGSSCTTCKEEYYNEKGSNDCRYRYCPENCKCKDKQCTSCNDGHYDISNSCNSTCPGNCVTCLSNTYCDICKDDYYNGYQRDDSSQPLLNTCTNKCRDNCRQCSSYNTCSKCQPGFYGAICETKCSPGCVTDTCGIQTGNCDCSLNFAGDKCDRCITGKYGNMCDKQCSKGCKDNVCEKDSGDCKNGCIVETIFGDKCDVCATGRYGSNCNLTCSIGCRNKKCKRIDGECVNRCINNFKGRQCNECNIGKYGELCNIDCPSNCDGNKCSKESGNCIKCLENFSGIKCESCVAALYGSTCSAKCPPKCLNNTCDRDSGTCSHGCIDNYSGDKCCINNMNCITCLSEATCKQCKSGYFDGLCDKRCSKNCAGSCHVETGRCDDCKSTFYGDMCTLPCSLTCKSDSNDIGNNCRRENGSCIYGCSEGFYGPKCTEKCSDRCVDNICDQEDGKCTMGCQMMKEDPFCSVKSASEQNRKEDNHIGTIVGAVVGVLVVIVVVVIVVVIMYKRRKNTSTDGPEYENTRITSKFGDGANVNNATSTAQASIGEYITKVQDYEDLSRVQVLTLVAEGFDNPGVKNLKAPPGVKTISPAGAKRISETKKTNNSPYENADRISASYKENTGKPRGNSYENLEMNQGSGDEYDDII